MTVSVDGFVGARGRGPGGFGMLSFSTHAVHCPDIVPRRWRVRSLHWSVVWMISFLNRGRNVSSAVDVMFEERPSLDTVDCRRLGLL